MSANVIRIADPDAPISRIYPLWFFEQALRSRNLALVAPESWEDPYEVLPSRVLMVHRTEPPWPRQSLAPYLKLAYGQCWSNTQESDTLLRAYSRVVKDPCFHRNTTPRDEGVWVRSTARKLLHALMRWSPHPPATSCFIGAVRYEHPEGIHRYIANALHSGGIEALATGRGRAELLLLKRKAFAHEAEVRLIFIDETAKTDQPLVHVPIDPNEIFDEIAFDPRLDPIERREREARAVGLGYAGRIAESDLYQGLVLQVFLDRPLWSSDAPGDAVSTQSIS